MSCDHKFVNSTCCLKCGWEPPRWPWPKPEPGTARLSLAPSPDYGEGLPDPEPCSCEEALALRERLERAEARARAWHRVARLKHRLLHERDSVGPGSRGVP